MIYKYQGYSASFKTEHPTAQRLNSRVSVLVFQERLIPSLISRSSSLPDQKSSTRKHRIKNASRKRHEIWNTN